MTVPNTDWVSASINTSLPQIPKRESLRTVNSFAKYGLSGIQPSALQPYHSGVKNSKTQGRDEGDFYRALAQAVGNVDDPKALETEVQTAPKNPPMTVGAYDKG